jgi:hypothetical protein
VGIADSGEIHVWVIDEIRVSGASAPIFQKECSDIPWDSEGLDATAFPGEFQGIEQA